MGTSHLKLIWVRGVRVLEYNILKPNILKHHIPEHPRISSRTSDVRAGRARQFVFAPPNLDGFMTVRKIVGHELDWLRRRFILVPPSLLAVPNLFTALFATLGT